MCVRVCLWGDEWGERERYDGYSVLDSELLYEARASCVRSSDRVNHHLKYV